MKANINYKTPNWLLILLAIILTLGVVFRFANIDKKIYWHDESYTTIRTTGYQAKEIADTIFQNRLLSTTELGKFQQLKPESNVFDTIQSLAKEDPQHPPLYFMISRYWEKIFGFSPVSSRSLAIVFSLLSLPFIYYLSLELFASKLTAILAVILLALSPVDIIFAQMSRQYSLLVLLTIISQLMLLKCLKKRTLVNWSLYTLSNTLGLYTHLFFILNLFAQATLIIWYLVMKPERKNNLIFFLLSGLTMIILYIPWLQVFLTNSQRAFNSTSWAAVNYLDWGLFGKLWLLTFTSLFSDSDFGFNNIFTYIYRMIFLILIIYAFERVYRYNNPIVFTFLITSTLVPFLALVIPDLILTTTRSTVTRYLIASFPTIYITVAFFLSQLLNQGKFLGKIILTFLLTASIISNFNNALSETSWAKVPSYWNGEVARKINAVPNAIIISDEGNDWTNLGDLLSLNYRLNADVQYFLTTTNPDTDKLKEVLEIPQANLFLFRPSNRLLVAIDQFDIRLDYFYPQGQLSRGKK
jgi:uncharacterized membrane protein